MTTTFRIYTVTYNVAETEPPEDLTRLLKLDSKTLPNIYVIGLQEIKAGVANLMTDAIYDDSWTIALTKCLCKRNFVRVKSVRLVGIHLCVFVRRIDLPCINNIESESTATGFGGYWGNKGGVSIRMDISGVSVCFVNSHLHAHLPYVAERIQEYNKIVESQSFRAVDTGTILDHDYVFWIGDLNFRIEDIPKPEIERKIAEGDLTYLFQYDQLKRAMAEQLLLVDFEEGQLNFPPTYKFNPASDVYDTSSKQRAPAWCDRVLWLTHEDAFEGAELEVLQMSYSSLPEYSEGDHRPVAAEFDVQVLRNPPELPVMFEPMDTWLSSVEQKCTYVTLDTYVIAADWVGLYKADFAHPMDYVTYQWASTRGEDLMDGSLMHSVTFGKSYLKDLEGLFCLCYFSQKKNCLVGYSDTFKISATPDDSTSNSSYSEMSSSDTDDASTGRPGTAADIRDPTAFRPAAAGSRPTTARGRPTTARPTTARSRQRKKAA